MKRGDRLHFIGIGGIGMSGLAQMCRDLGYIVTGSDRGYLQPENRRILDKLEQQDIRIYPQDGSFCQDERPDYLVYSTAVEEGNPDFVAGEGIPRLHRSEALEAAVAQSGAACTIAVSGSCGKSTVTAYLAETLVNLGCNPACLDGALVNRFISGSFAGNYRTGDGRFFVYEADESDRSLLRYHPDYAMVLNIGTDHYSKEELAEVFAAFLGNVRRGAVISREVADLLGDKVPPHLPVMIFEAAVGAAGERAVRRCFRTGQTDAVFVDGEAAELDAFSGDRPAFERSGAGNILRVLGAQHEDFRLESRRFLAELGDGALLELPQPGDHTALNALAVMTMLEMIGGFERSAVIDALSRFSGVWRRFDWHGTTASGARVYDDYAHNPEKIASAFAAAREICDGKILAVFQPHGYGPLGFMREELYQVLHQLLRREDEWLMLEPFYAGGTSSFKPTSEEVIAEYRERSGRNAFLAMPDREHLTDYLLLKSRPGDVILIMGARDNSLSDYARSLCAEPRF